MDGDGLCILSFLVTFELTKTSPNLISGVQLNGAKVSRGTSSATFSTFFGTGFFAGGEMMNCKNTKISNE